MENKKILIISGNGRNTGKTSFLCRVISAHKNKYPVTAIKISPHFHPDTSTSAAIISNNNYSIFVENDPRRSKDSSRMIAAGATKVYYIEAIDEHLAEAWRALSPLIADAGPVVCESGGLRNLLKPSLFIMLNRSERVEIKDSFKKLSPLADKIVSFNGNSFDHAPEEIHFDGKGWEMK